MSSKSSHNSWLLPLLTLTIVCQSDYVHAGLEVLGVVGGGSVVNGSSPLLVLDCHYIIPQGEEAGLVVKWYHERNPRPVYQWIYGSEPQALGPLRGRLDLRYQSSPERLKAHSALAFVTPTSELAGRYTCRVATYFDEGAASTNLIIYSPATHFALKVTNTSPYKIDITCSAEGLYPQPEMVLARTDYETQRRTVLKATPKLTWDASSKLSNLTSKVSITPAQLHSLTYFECLLSIPGTDYRKRQTVLYRPDYASLPSTVSAASFRSTGARIVDSALCTQALLCGLVIIGLVGSRL